MMDSSSSSDNQRRQITESILRRKDPDIVEFSYTCDHVVLYKHVDNNWQHTQIEGGMHVVSRSSHPHVQLIIYNRKSTQNFYHDFTPQSIQLQQQIPYILFRHKENPQDIYGLWFYNKVHAMSFVDQFYKLMAASSSTAPQQQQHSFQQNHMQQNHMQQNAPPQLPRNQPRMVHLSDMSMDLTQMLRTQLNIQPPTSMSPPMPHPVAQHMHLGSGNGNAGEQIMQMLNSTPPQQMSSVPVAHIGPSVTSIEQSNATPPSASSTSGTTSSTKPTADQQSKKKSSRGNKKNAPKPDPSPKNAPVQPMRILKRGQDVSELKAASASSDTTVNGSGSAPRSDTTTSQSSKTSKASKSKSSPQRKRPTNPKSSSAVPPLAENVDILEPSSASSTPSPSSFSSTTDTQTTRKNNEIALKMLPPQYISSELRKSAAAGNKGASSVGAALDQVETKEQFKQTLVQLITNDQDTRFIDAVFRHYMLSKKFGGKLTESST